MEAIKKSGSVLGNSTLLCTLLLLTFGFLGKAQIKTTKETKLIVVVSPEGEITSLELFENSGSNRERLEKTYPQSDYFLGALSGRYELQDNQVVPVPESTVKVYKGHRLFAGNGFLEGKDLEKRKDIQWGETKAHILENNKGELTLKITNDEN